jgi:hypothetical protein
VIDPSSLNRSVPTGALLAPVAPDLVGAAVRLGHDCWWQSRLFEVVGGWVPSETDLTAKLLFGRQCAHFAWRAEQWHDRLPELRELHREAFVVAPNRSGSAVVEALAASSGTVERLAGLYRVVLPRLVTSYERHLAAASPATDGPIVRALQLVLNDEIEDWHAGERLVERLMTRPHDVAAVHEFLQRLETSVVGAGARTGLVVFPGPVPEG